MTGPPQGLSTFLALTPDSRHAWNREDLASIFQHEIHAPLRLALGDLSALLAHAVEELPAGKPEPKSIEELLMDAAPPADLLTLLKRFGRRCSQEQASALPKEVGLALYYASIGIARQRKVANVSSLPDAELIKGLRWALSRDWIGDQVRPVLSAALQTVEESTGCSSAPL
ncbi:MAG TPA: hypothetical protein VM008_09775 [Phycisphaerae bacterium]|nr:hypothetical protein [Phycisphaerae bacterium]